MKSTRAGSQNPDHVSLISIFYIDIVHLLYIGGSVCNGFHSDSTTGSNQQEALLPRPSSSQSHRPRLWDTDLSKDIRHQSHLGLLASQTRHSMSSSNHPRTNILQLVQFPHCALRSCFSLGNGIQSLLKPRLWCCRARHTLTAQPASHDVVVILCLHWNHMWQILSFHMWHVSRHRQGGSVG